jgi:circadian clock protein KaiB
VSETVDVRPAARRGALLDSNRYLLKLYITGKTPRTERAIANLRNLCEDVLAEAYEIEIIDILEHPRLAEDERILATPTLIKQLPPPLRRVIGDLSDRDKVLLGLDLRPKERSEA